MTIESSGASDDNESDNDNDNTETSSSASSSTLRIMESVMRISLAGFGGALVGLSLSRQKQHSTTSGRPRRPVRVDSTLPMHWAFACAGFCSLIEMSRWASPASLVTSSPHAITIGDYAFGGAAAGAAFRGMQVAQRSSRANILSGLASGIVLGCLAGIVQCAADVGEEMVRQHQNSPAASPQESPSSATGDTSQRGKSKDVE